MRLGRFQFGEFLNSQRALLLRILESYFTPLSLFAQRLLPSYGIGVVIKKFRTYVEKVVKKGTFKFIAYEAPEFYSHDT